ncbi:MAG: ATP-binding cassette domain-containing protein [Bacteroidota bacterium]|nr:ATP-binding cassette domain-containing protein [Candidatus Kapabacteria bacterium]MDW8220536.1 ATP-binding cassette domain-containing protein [Bacteroidota bacterium]
MTDAIIQVRNLTVRFGERTVFENISFDVPRGKIFVILGGSGCGKSTLLRTLTGLVSPICGSIQYDGIEFLGSTGLERQSILQKFGILFQSGGLLNSMTLAENIALPLQEATLLPDERIMEIVRMKLASVGLQGYETFLPGEISGGMKKRAGIARAMALDPAILFFDEPSAGLDPISSAALDKLIRKLNAALGTTMVVVTHELHSIEDIADEVIMLDKSARGIIAQGSLSDVKAITDDRRVYNFFHRVVES